MSKVTEYVQDVAGNIVPESAAAGIGCGMRLKVTRLRGAVAVGGRASVAPPWGRWSRCTVKFHFVTIKHVVLSFKL